MSFYQPSLSLFDVLNALSDQARLRDPQQRVSQRHPHHHGHVHSHRNAQNPFHGPYSTARNEFFDPFGSYDSPAGYFYRDPQDNYYYSPQYDENDNYDKGEGEEEEEPEEDEKMSGTEENPSYYHTREGDQHDRTAEAQQEYQNRRRDYLNDLFNAFTGTEPRYGEEDESSVDEEAKERGDTAAKLKSEEVEQQPKGKHETTEKPKVSTTEEKKSTTSTETATPAPKPKLRKRVSSHAHLSAPSPIPDPLQVSKPETRLDLPFTPEVNVYDMKNEYVVVLALPGASSKAFKVDYHPSSHELLVRGNVIDRLGIEEKFLKITEIKYGAFERTIKFPVLPRIKDEEIKAKYSNGLLQIRVPKMDSATEKPAPKKRITIEDIPDAELEFEKNPNPVEKI